MTSDNDYHPIAGDWVRFYRDGELRIAEVRYVRRTGALQTIELSTTDGAVDLRSVLEARREPHRLDSEVTHR